MRRVITSAEGGNTIAGALPGVRRGLASTTQAGINCAVFRNEGSIYGRSSELIEEAKRLAWERWPGERLYTFINPKKVRHKRDPGRCFLRAGFDYCGVTKKRKLLILECFPPERRSE